MFHRLLLVFASLLLVLAASAGVWRYGYLQALDQVARRGEADLALASDRLVSQLQRYQMVAVIMADHPMLNRLFDENAPVEAEQSQVNDLLLGVTDKTSALTMFYIDTNGRVRAQSHDHLPPNPAQSGYFARAMDGALGTGHGSYDTSGRRAYYYAAPDFDASGKVRGALVTVADIEYIEWEWRGERPTMFFVDTGGVVFVSNRSELVFAQRAVDDAALAKNPLVIQPARSRQTGAHEIWVLDWGPYVPNRALHLERNLPVIDLMAEALVDVAPALRLAWLQAMGVGAILLTFVLLLFVATERRRTLALANAQLEDQVAKRTAALKRAQDDLVQAGKLSALGQMSAGISHELNQPLMAIQQFAANGAAFLGRGQADVAADNLTRIEAMANRMSRIIKNLRAFARNEREALGKVDLISVITTAVELTEARLRQDDIKLQWDAGQHGPGVYVIGGEVRLVQVFVNLINNAADAMAAQTSTRQISIDIQTTDKLSVTVRDTGPGIADPKQVFDPFYTTKPVGNSEGMGLGLSISYGLVQSFGGNIRASNGATGGALMTVELEPWQEAAAA